jgi:hypothetical protein
MDGDDCKDLRKDMAHTPIEKYNVNAIDPRYAAVKGKRGPERRCITVIIVLVEVLPSLVVPKINSTISLGLWSFREPSHIQMGTLHLYNL